MISAAKSISETLNKGESHYVELRKSSKTRNQTASPSKKHEDDKLETMTRDSHYMIEPDKELLVNYNDPRAFKSSHFQSQKKAQQTKGKQGGFLNFLGCCDGR